MKIREIRGSNEEEEEMDRRAIRFTAWLIIVFSGLTVIFWGTGQTFSTPTAVRFVGNGSVGLNGTVRVLCYQTPTADPFADLELAVSAGNPTPALPNNCNYLSALHQIAVVDSAKKEHGPAFTVYHASFSPTDTTPLLASGDVVINSDNRLTLFHVVASLAWHPASGSDRLTPSAMREALRGASAYLYDLTEGQMAFGPVKINTGGENWSGSDIRVLPANDRRPSAFVGGITDNIRVYDGGTATTLYTPAEIYLGRAWDGGLGAADPDLGRWTNVVTGTRTIAHEWAHYALFLYDEYQQTGGGSQYCICETLPSGCGLGDIDGSAMAYHYTAGEFWHQLTHISNYNKTLCESTWNWHFHGNTDWKVIADWGSIQGKPIDAINFPGVLATQLPSLAADFFGREPGRGIYLPLVTDGSEPPGEPFTEPSIRVNTEAILSAGRWPFTEVYIYENGFENPARILPMGRVRGPGADPDDVGSIRLLGVRADDRARILVHQFDDGGLFSYPNSSDDVAVDLIDGLEVLTKKHSWNYALDHRFEVEEGVVTAVSLQLDSTLSKPPIIQLCAVDPEIGCEDNWQKEMGGSGSTWTQTFTAAEAELAELPRFLVVRVEAPEKGLEGDLVQWIQVSGGVGPGHVDGIAPLVDGEVMLNSSNTVVGDPDCTISSYAPARNTKMLIDPLPPNRVLVSQPMLVRIEVTQDVCPTINLGSDATFSYNVIINLGYEQVDVERVGAVEGNLRLLRYSSGSGWVEVQTVTVNQDLNLLIGGIGSDGIYAVGAVVP
ncbi:MAG: hypothetical protein QNJ45_16850 [Ardenticatenaceae bacterium]|nr:hypothetical protein [Ardenticatenaceae bacterium]